MAGELRGLLSAEEDTPLRQDCASWLEQVLFPAGPCRDGEPGLLWLEEAERMLEDRVDGWSGEHVRRARQQAWQGGQEKGRAKGRQEGQERLLLRQLERKFRAVPDGVRRRITEASTGELDTCCDRVLDAETLEEVHGRESR